jgi:hypothetical protein
MLYYIQSFWKYLSQIWSKRPPFIERIPDYSSEGSQKTVLIYDDDASSEGSQKSVLIYDDDSSCGEESLFYSRA